jgi:hypothetical protein
MFRIALAKAEKGDTHLLGRYFLEDGKITNYEALGRALIRTKPRRGKIPTEANEIALEIWAKKEHARKANGGELPRGLHRKLIDGNVNAAWHEDGRWQHDYKKLNDPARKRLFEEEYRDQAEADIRGALENLRKKISRETAHKK